MLFSLRMAWAYFRKTWARGIWGVMMIISITGIAIGVASLVVTLSVMNGFHTEITSKLLSLNPHILVMNPFMGIDIADNLDDELKMIGILENYTPFVYGKGLLHHSGRSQGVVVKGVNADRRQPELSEGKWHELVNDGVIMGRELANILGLEYGDDVYLIIPKIEQIGAPVIPRVEKFKVAGIFDSGIYEYDSTLAYIAIDTAESIFSDGSAASGVELYLEDPFKAEIIASQMRERLSGRYFNIQTWKDRNYNLFAALKLEKTMMFIVLIMIVLVATFNIAGTLILISVTKSKDCGVMRALGATKRQIRYMFHFKGLILGFTGTLVGTACGLAIAAVLKRYSFIQLPPKVYLISTLPVKVNPADIFLIMVTAIIISLIATIYPSYRAGKLEVAQELRNE
ncbi:MAG: FtsX-like permease family protein [Elusimicrobiota bacterium]